MQLIKFNKAEYDYLRITPIIGLRNFNNKDLASTINKLFQKYNIFQKNIDNIGININPLISFSYIIDISKKDTQFIFKVPAQFVEFSTKLQENFKDTLISKIDYKREKLNYRKNLAYRNEDPLSLHIDSKQQQLINNILENIEILNDNDRVIIEIEIFKIGKVQRIQFKDFTKEVERKIKTGESVKVSRGIIEGIGNAIINTTLSITNGLLGTDKKENRMTEIIYALANQEELKMNKATLNKKSEDLLNVAISISSTSKNALESTINSFSVLDEDNSLIATKSEIFNVMSVSEVGQILQVPGHKELMEKFNITHLKHKEFKLPIELCKGTLKIGNSTYRNSNQNLYLSDDGSNKFLAAAIAGSTRSGKTTLIQNLINNAIANGDSAIFFDFIETCRSSNEILAKLPKNKVVIINLAKKVEGLDFNEIIIDNISNEKEQYKMLKLKANGVLALIDSCNLTNDEELKAQMRKILMSITLITFSQNKPFKIAIQALQDHILRKELINNIPTKLKDKLKESIMNLKSLDEKAKNGAIVGTKLHLVNSILNRLYALQLNVALEEMLETSSENNINMISEMQRSKFIVIQIPDAIAPTNLEKDIICSYYFNRIWFALQQRALTIEDKDKKRLLIVIDEIYQLKQTENLVKERINQISKFCAKFIVSCHSINQIKNLKSELISADASYILISGCDESNLKDLKERFSDYDNTNLKNLKKYHALCSLKTNSNGYVQCIAKLPKPI